MRHWRVGKHLFEEGRFMGTCAVVAASDFNSRRFCELADAGMFDHIVAVDGGYEHLRRIGYAADIALGDFDSLGYVPRDVAAEVFSPHKDASDMELALDRVHTQGFSQVYVFGALGRRLDHTVANMQLFARYSEEGLSVKVEDDENELVFLSGPAALSLPAHDAGTVSVFSMSDVCTGVSERGLKWELDSIKLTNRTSLGLSNECIGVPAEIRVQAGTLVVFLPL